MPNNHMAPSFPSIFIETSVTVRPCWEMYLNRLSPVRACNPAWCWPRVRTREQHPSCRWLQVRVVFLEVHLWHSTPSSNLSAIYTVADSAELPVYSCKTGKQTTAQEWLVALSAKTQQMGLCHQALPFASPWRKQLTSECWRRGHTPLI